MGIDLISASRDYIIDQSTDILVQDSDRVWICTYASLTYLRTSLLHINQVRSNISYSPDQKTTPDHSISSGI